MGISRTDLFLFSIFYLQILNFPDSQGGELSRYEQVRGRLNQIVSSYPKNARLFALGVFDSGQPIEGLVLGEGSVSNLVVATHHGNEYGSTEVALGLDRHDE